MFTFGISSGFPELSPASWQITHVLRTLAPLNIPNIATRNVPLDLHVLSTPPAFVLSQNQTLRQLNDYQSPTLNQNQITDSNLVAYF